MYLGQFQATPTAESLSALMFASFKQNKIDLIGRCEEHFLFYKNVPPPQKQLITHYVVKLQKD